MLLDRQNDTPFDLRFRFFGTPVRILPWFWLVTVFLGFDFIKLGIDILVLWVLCVFFSILLHEFGHVWMGMIFGNRGHIVLQGMCGLAIGAREGISERWKRIAVSLAGPGIQFLFYGLIAAGLHLYTPPPSGALREMDLLDQLDYWLFSPPVLPGWSRWLYWGLHFLMWINLYWAIINLLPIWPLDGGQVSRELFVWGNRVYGVRNSLGLSLATALVVTINALSGAMKGPTIPYLPTGDRFFIVFFAVFAFESFMQLQIETARTRDGWRDPDDEDRLPWERDPDEWKRQ